MVNEKAITTRSRNLVFMKELNIVYHYYPQFRHGIFRALEKRSTPNFVYGMNARFGVSNLTDDRHDVRRNFYIGKFILQTFGISTLYQICRNDSIILGDIKFINSWFYTILGRVCGKKVWLWTHGVTKQEGGMKWLFWKFYYNLANGLMLYSSNEASLMAALGFTGKIAVIGNSNYQLKDAKISLSYPACREELKSGICYIGRISVEKGFLDYIDLANLLPHTPIRLIGPIAKGLHIPASLPPNLTLHQPVYEFNELRNLTSDCGTFVLFSPAGLGAFTAVFLSKRLFVRNYVPQKPEFHILNKYGLVFSFDSTNQLVGLIQVRSLSNCQDFERARTQFLKNNSSEAVADRILQAMQSSL